MEEDGEDRQRCHETHQEEVDAKETLRDGPPVGELILHQFLGHDPAEENTGQETTDGEEDLSGHEIEDIEQRLTANLQPAPVAQRQGADSPDDGTSHRHDDSTFLTGDMQLLIEESRRDLMQ